MEIIERHTVPISSKDKHAFTYNSTSMAISCWWSLAAGLGQGLIIVVCWHASSLLFERSLADQCIGLLETWISVLYEERVPHGHWCWRLKLDNSLISLDGSNSSELWLWLSLALRSVQAFSCCTWLQRGCSLWMITSFTRRVSSTKSLRLGLSKSRSRCLHGWLSWWI